MAECECVITRGNICVDCGAKIYEIHDKPCRECRHSERLIDGWICVLHLMAITPDMNVTYKIGRTPKDGGLCFEAKD